jgi:hypothetical protein
MSLNHLMGGCGSIQKHRKKHAVETLEDLFAIPWGGAIDAWNRGEIREFSFTPPLGEELGSFLFFAIEEFLSIRSKNQKFFFKAIEARVAIKSHQLAESLRRQLNLHSIVI